MKKMEWIREALSVWPSPEYLKQRETAGWRMVAVEWEREVQAEASATREGLASSEEIPYGTRIAERCRGPDQSESWRQLRSLLGLQLKAEVRMSSGTTECRR